MIPCDIFGPPNEDGMHVLETDTGDVYQMDPNGTWFVTDLLEVSEAGPVLACSDGEILLPRWGELVHLRERRSGSMRFD